LIRVISVPHTGTRFIEKCLLGAGLVKTDDYWGMGDFVQIHFDGKMNAPIIHAPKKPGAAIMPLRDKEEVKASWTRRGESLSRLELCWAEMESWLEDHDDVLVVHVDNPACRENELAAISERLGVPLSADFNEKVGHGE